MEQAKVGGSWLPWAVALVFGLIAGSGIYLTAGGGRISAIWFANGWVLGFMLSDREERWREFLGAAVLVNIATSVFATGRLLEGCAFAISNAIEISVSYFALRKHVRGPDELFSGKAFKRFLFWAVLIAPLVGTLCASSAFTWLFTENFLETFLRRFAAHMLGVVVVTPLVLAALLKRQHGASDSSGAGHWLPYFVLASCTLAIFAQSHFPLLFLIFPPFLWVVFRHGYFGSAMAVAIVSVIAVVATVMEIGPLMLIAHGLPTRVIIVQLLLATLVVTAYPICALLSRQRELLESSSDREQQLRVIADNSRDLIVRTNIDGRRLYVSPAIKEMLGYTPAEALNTQGAGSIHRDDREMYEREEASLAAGADGTMTSYRVRHRDGHFVWVEVTAKTIRNTQGEVTGWISATRDISERKRIEQIKDDLIATVSHELRTPLTSINGALGLAQSGHYGQLSASLTRLLDMAHANGKRLALLLNDFLDLEKLSSGKMPLVLENWSVAKLLEDASTANAAYGIKRNVRIVIERSCDIELRVDAHRFQQIMSNLLSNAVKFSPEGAVVEMGAHCSDDRCTIYVADHGSGIPKEFRTRLFERFSQADASDSRSRSGTGLGMAIAKQMTVAMGGEITVESEVDRGTTFRLSFPALPSTMRIAV